MKKKRATYRCRGSIRMHLVPILVWVVAVGAVIFFLQRRSERFEVFGLAIGQVREISSTSSGRLVNVPVQLFQPVTEGDPVAIVDTVLDHKHLEEELEAKRRVMVAEIDRLKAELAATADRMEAEAMEREDDALTIQRRLALDVEDARLRALELKAQIETDQVALEELQLDKKIFVAQGRFQQQGASPLELERTQAAYNTLAKRVEENQQLLAQAEINLKHAQKRLDDFNRRQMRHPSTDLALDVIRKQIRVQEEAVAEILQDRVALVIESPFDGVVSAIQRSPGEAILPGQPILTISETAPREIVAYISRSQVARIQPNMRVELRKEGDTVQAAYSQITHLGPDFQLMPEQLRSNPGVPQWGRPLLIKIPPGFQLIPGELVRIKAI